MSRDWVKWGKAGRDTNLYRLGPGLLITDCGWLDASEAAVDGDALDAFARWAE